ncbi:hypothetical protein [Ramlibacter pallidus]|uniref:Uncharacterized protein n=1 Tax=Ramlibacter pallidus TaxID=2780087 RepID=A0ABR9S307_9BURK|nr:hypothetical protein [Ramlibacter pallidus]MBE7367880.1 hypothetical protein [Ramlibacter pallidus]
MTLPELPADVRRFILTSVPSVPYLEAVLLLRAEPARAWDAAQLARRLYVPERNGVELIGLLKSSSIAQPVGDTSSVRYAPSAELGELLDRVAQAYASDLVAVTDLIHSRIDRRAQQFADAFRFRKE